MYVQNRFMEYSLLISLITDSEYFDGLASYYKGDILIINVVRLEERKGIQHLSIRDAEKIISLNKPTLDKNEFALFMESSIDITHLDVEFEDIIEL